MSKDLKITQLPPEYGEEDLRRLFAVAGQVRYVHLVTDPTSGASRCCAYVTMASEAQAKDAIDCLDGARVEHHSLRVRFAQPRPAPSGPGGGRPRGPAGRGPKQGR